MQKSYMKTPVGNLEIMADEIGICEINFTNNFINLDTKNTHIKKCIKELNEYFSGNLREFSVNLHIVATQFQRSVYEALLCIKYGKTATYGDIAKMINLPKSYRAVGNANSKNKIPIIIPCHRIVSQNSIGGYSGGIEIKKFLLDLESKFN